MNNKTIETLREKFDSKKAVKFEIPESEVQWPHLVEPDDRYEKPGKFKFNCILDDELAAEMEAVGFNVKDETMPELDEDGNKVLLPNGKVNYIATGRKMIIPTRKAEFGPPKITAGGKPYTGDIGNGSKATCKVSAKFVTVAGKTHLPVYLDEVDITDLVEYEGTSSKVEKLF